MHILDIQPPQTLELNVIHNVDCLKGLSLLPDNSVDLCITSPPYIHQQTPRPPPPPPKPFA